MNRPPTPAEVRTGMRLMRIYREAAAHILAEEQAAEARALPTESDLVTARTVTLTVTPDDQARLAAYVDRLEQTHGGDPAMRLVIDRFRAALAAQAPAPMPRLEVA